MWNTFLNLKSTMKISVNIKINVLYVEGAVSHPNDWISTMMSGGPLSVLCTAQLASDVNSSYKTTKGKKKKRKNGEGDIIDALGDS